MMGPQGKTFDIKIDPSLTSQANRTWPRANKNMISNVNVVKMLN